MSVLANRKENGIPENCCCIRQSRREFHICYRTHININKNGVFVIILERNIKKKFKKFQYVIKINTWSVFSLKLRYKIFK